MKNIRFLTTLYICLEKIQIKIGKKKQWILVIRYFIITLT